ncbi:restriction endonuclease subunit S [Pseudomonas plecoglossicida]|uniref:restriction endonuclease subunit S n=1 Tax=Pseudomonas plecoglossicida TaxID=70775 RepID=UPI003977B184
MSTQVKPGYKVTDIGVLPLEWNVKKLGEITTLMTNGFVGTATSAYVKSDNGILYVQGFNVEPNSFNFRGIKRVSAAFHAQNQKSCLRTGDLLTIQTGDIGTTTLVPPSLAGANCHALVISRLELRRSSPGFYCQYFNSDQGRAAFKVIETGTTMKHLNVGDMVRLLVPSPPLDEQQAIATALFDMDALISGLEQLIVKKIDIKQAAMQQLLTGRQRLPGFSGAWSSRRLADICYVYSGGTPSTSNSEYYSGNIPWITSGDLNKRYITEVSGRISELGLSNSSARIVNANTLLVALYGATAGVTAISKIKAAINQAVLAIIPSRGDVSFLYFKLSYLKDWIIATYTQGGQPNLSGAIVKSIEMLLPEMEEQIAIASILSDMDAELAALEARRDKAIQLKQAMMQELLTGRIRFV